MKPIAKAVLAGAAGAVGIYGVDTYVIGPNQPKPPVYYAASAGAALGAYLLRKNRVALGALVGLAAMTSFLGYQHQAASAALAAPKPSPVPPPAAPPYPYPYPPPSYGYPPPPAPQQYPAASSGPSFQDAQKYLQQGQQWAQQIQQSFGSESQAVPWEAPEVSDDDYYNSY